MCIPRTLWVGKVGLTDGLEQPSSTTGPSPLGSMGPRAGQVKTRTNYQSRSVCSAPQAQSPPLPHAHQTRYQPPTKMVKSSLLRPTTKQSPPQHHHPACSTTFLCRCSASLFLQCLSQGRQGRSFQRWLYCQPPRHPLAHLLHLATSLGGMPNSRASLAARSCLCQKHFSSSTVIYHGISVYPSSDSLKT